MRTILLTATAALLCSATPAAASVITLGTRLAESCYQAAEASRPSDSAITLCDQALENEPLSGPDRVGTHVNRGILRMLSDDMLQANRDFDKAISLDPSEPEAWLNKAVAALKVGSSASALQFAERAMALKTRKPELALYVRAMANEDRGNVRAAYDDLRRAAALAPGWDVPAAELARYRIK